MGKFVVVDAVCQLQFCQGAKHLKVKKRIYVGEKRINLHSAAADPCLLFHFIVNEISRNKAKN